MLRGIPIMSVMGRLFLIVLVFLVVLGLGRAIVSFSVNDWARELWALPEQAWNIGEERERDRELTFRSGAVLRKIKAKDYIAIELIEGRLSLLEAVQRFRGFDGRRSDLQEELFRKFIPGASEEERYCRFVIGWACNVLEVGSAQALEVRRRFEAELEQLSRDGRLNHP
jgi:hypothetical protein